MAGVATKLWPTA